MLESKELVWGAVGDDVGVYIYNLGELGLLPEIDLCKRRVEIGAVHQVEVRSVLVADPRDRNDLVEDGPELRDGLGGDAVERDEDGELSGGARIAKGVREHKSACIAIADRLAVVHRGWKGAVG